MTTTCPNQPQIDDNDEWPSEWPQWVTEALDKLDHIEKRFPRDVLHGAPAWANKMCFRIIQMMHPATTYNAETRGAAFLGSTLGHFMWLIESDNGLSAMMDRLEEASERFDRLLRANLTKKQYDDYIEALEKNGAFEEHDRFSRSFLRLLMRKRKVLAECTQLATNQIINEQVEFYDAYADALRKPPMDETGALTREKFPNTGMIYLVMMLNWKLVKGMRSGAACHAWLCSVLDERLVGTRHRIEKMAYKFGINFSHRKRKKRKKKRRNRT